MLEPGYYVMAVAIDSTLNGPFNTRDAAETWADQYPEFDIFVFTHTEAEENIEQFGPILLQPPEPQTDREVTNGGT